MSKSDLYCELSSISSSQLSYPFSIALLFMFNHLDGINNRFPNNIICIHVKELSVADQVQFEEEFFHQFRHCYPVLTKLYLFYSNLSVTQIR